jgi:hypothetical protein
MVLISRARRNRLAPVRSAEFDPNLSYKPNQIYILYVKLSAHIRDLYLIPSIRIIGLLCNYYLFIS